MLKRDAWLPLSRQLDWEFSYVTPDSAFPELAAGVPALGRSEWDTWEEPFKTSYTEYVEQQSRKEAALEAVQSVIDEARQAAEERVALLSAQLEEAKKALESLGATGIQIG